MYTLVAFRQFVDCSAV